MATVENPDKNIGDSEGKEARKKRTKRKITSDPSSPVFGIVSVFANTESIPQILCHACAVELAARHPKFPLRLTLVSSLMTDPSATTPLGMVYSMSDQDMGILAGERIFVPPNIRLTWPEENPTYCTALQVAMLYKAISMATPSRLLDLSDHPHLQTALQARARPVMYITLLPPRLNRSLAAYRIRWSIYAPYRYQIAHIIAAMMRKTHTTAASLDLPKLALASNCSGACGVGAALSRLLSALHWRLRVIAAVRMLASLLFI